MKKLLFLGIAASALILGATPLIKSNKVSTEERDATIIVKMNTNVENYSQKQLRSIQNSLLNEIATNVTSNYKVRTRYSNIFNGFVLEVPAAYVTQIRNLNRVDKVNYNIMLAEEVKNNDGYNYVASESLSIDTRTASTSTMKKPEGTNDGKGTFVAILDSCFYIKEDAEGHQEYHHVFAPLNDEDAVLSQADVKARIDAKKESFHGLYDETHSTYYNNKVVFYYDYAGDESAGINPDYDVFSEGSDHGTHVASLAGGNAGDEFEGIAPKSQMALMKVFRIYMSGQSYVSGAPADAVLSALEDCLILGVDTLNMSLGTNLNDFDDAEIVQDVIRELDAKGTFVNVAAGNEGKGQYNSTIDEYWSTDMVESNILSSYANNNGAMTIASSQADSLFYGSALTLDGENIQYSDQVVNYQSTTGPVTYDPERHIADLVDQYSKTDFDFVYLPGVGKEAEYTGIDATGKIVITNRGDITFREKVDTAVAKGAIAVGIINNEAGNEFNMRMAFSSDDSENYTPAVPVVFFLKKTKESFESTTATQLKFLINTVLPNPQANTISDYSSDGMKYDLTIKPEISSPGQEIKGAVPGAVDKYEAMSGTSMATPNFTGGVALMIGEHLGDANYRATIKARLMSTAEPMKDYSGTTYTSVRRQGAGLVNLDSALNSEVYLDGLDAQGNRLGKAKVEFFNNDNIKAGKINMKFAAINEGAEAVTYKATTYVLAPGTETPTDLNEKYSEFNGHKFQVVEEQLVQTFEENVTIQPGEHTITLQEHQVDAEKLAALRADFADGCVLEGYTILTAENKPQLSIPFLGFYGDLEAVSPVEPFDYNRTEGKIYDSDILNAFLTRALIPDDDQDFSKIDYRSHIASGYWESKSKVSVANYFMNNSNNMLNMTDGNSNRVKLLGANPFDGSLSDRWVVGNNGFSNTLIMQQYVKRSVMDNHIYLRNKATQEIVATEQLNDNYTGTTHLYKSHFDYTGLYSSGYMAHRAYCVFPLFKVEGSKFVAYPDGEYELEFEYELAAGSTYRMVYNLTIESDLPVLQSFEKVGDNYRLFYNDTNASVAYINDKPYQIVNDENGIHADVPANLFAENDKALIKSVDAAYGQETFLTHMNDPYRLMVYNKMFTTTYDFATEVTKASANDLTFALNITSNGKNGTTNGNITYRLPIPEGIDKNTVKAYSVAANGKEKELKVTLIDNLMQFETTTRTFHLVSEPVTLESIAVVVGKTDYNQGESIDLSTITVTATYSDGNTKVLTADEFTLSLTKLDTAGEVTVTVTSGGKTASFTLNVQAGETPTPDKPAKKGCGGSIIAASAIISIASLLGAGLLLFKRKED